MSRLDIAVQRFNAAVEALDSRAAPLAGLKAAAADSKARIAELAEERDRLLGRIAELEEENRALAATTEEVEGRLDGAIGEIRAALGR
jgi:chromosome segregation ATPase